jgi:hypothetical protein
MFDVMGDFDVFKRAQVLPPLRASHACESRV